MYAISNTECLYFHIELYWKNPNTEYFIGLDGGANWKIVLFGKVIN
jgi:hypothetical protein